MSWSTRWRTFARRTPAWKISTSGTWPPADSSRATTPPWEPSRRMSCRKSKLPVRLCGAVRAELSKFLSPPRSETRLLAGESCVAGGSVYPCAPRQVGATRPEWNPRVRATLSRVTVVLVRVIFFLFLHQGDYFRLMYRLRTPYTRIA